MENRSKQKSGVQYDADYQAAKGEPLENWDLREPVNGTDLEISMKYGGEGNVVR